MLNRDVFIKRHKAYAGKWIYQGYKNAWNKLGYNAQYYDRIEELENASQGFYLMAMDADIHNDKSTKIIQKSQKTFLYAQPNIFPSPWGAHPNFVCHCPDDFIDMLNKMTNVVLWSFANINTEFYTKWANVDTVPLAFDDNLYKPQEDAKYKFDVCFIGGWANNGFNEKQEIMLQHFAEFKESGLKCGFFINRNISQEMENRLLYNSKVSINIHDAYQRILGLDTNERTFKSLGLNGILISDNIQQIKDILPTHLVEIVDTPKEMVNKIKFYISMDNDERESVKNKNRDLILKEHCYTNRVQTLLTL